MPTENKTTNLKLNNWLSTDKPRREDFINDNAIIDRVLGEHIADKNLHITDEFLASLSFESAVVGLVAGDGAASKSYTLSFSPKVIFVFILNQPVTKYDATNNYTLCNFGISCPGFGSTKGISLSGNTLTLSQSQSTPTDKVFINLNRNYGQYVYIAFK